MSANCVRRPRRWRLTTARPREAGATPPLADPARHARVRADRGPGVGRPGHASVPFICGGNRAPRRHFIIGKTAADPAIAGQCGHPRYHPRAAPVFPRHHERPGEFPGAHRARRWHAVDRCQSEWRDGGASCARGCRCARDSQRHRQLDQPRWLSGQGGGGQRAHRRAGTDGRHCRRPRVWRPHGHVRRLPLADRRLRGRQRAGGGAVVERDAVAGTAAAAQYRRACGPGAARQAGAAAGGTRCPDRTAAADPGLECHAGAAAGRLCAAVAVFRRPGA